MKSMIVFYNEQVDKFISATKKIKLSSKLDRQNAVEDLIDKDSKKISWTRSTKNFLSKHVKHRFHDDAIIISQYRPFCKLNLYFDKTFNEMIYQMPKIFPDEKISNIAICVPNTGSRREFSALMVSNLPDLNLQDAGTQAFPLYTYQKINNESNELDLFAPQESTVVIEGFQKLENVSETSLKIFQKTYKNISKRNITKNDIFYYIYGILHSKEYKKRFGHNLKKMLPRIPMSINFWDFKKAGEKLSNLHVGYEEVSPFSLEESVNSGFKKEKSYNISKMHFSKINGKDDKSTIIYNNDIKLSGIPLEAYEYEINGRSAIEWVMDRYQISTDKDSGLINNPNDWCEETEDAEYILNLIKKITTVSIETIKIVNKLPKIDEIIL
jgi:predicted helicase